MGDEASEAALHAGLAHALARAGLPPPEGLARLTGGATMESWHFRSRGEAFVLRRAPSARFIADRPFGHASEAAVIVAAHRAGVIAPEVVIVLTPEDGIGSGYIMRALAGVADPRSLLAMDNPGRLLADAAASLARIHMLAPEALPDDIPELHYPAGVAQLRDQFLASGGDRPIIALGLAWLERNCPPRVAPVLNHGDFRLGNLLAHDSRLTGVLDWELVHFGDPHEDLAFGCLPVWRFGRYERPALGLGTLEEYFAAYEAHSGRKVDAERFRFWTIYRTVWWAIGCLRNARMWREGEDRMLERVVISRRTSEQELDLLLLLEEEAPAAERDRPLPQPTPPPRPVGEARAGEIASAVAEFLATLKDRLEGHDRFQLAVARNALGIVAREVASPHAASDAALSASLLAGTTSLADEGILARLRAQALAKLAVDGPKYPSLAIARQTWTGTL